MVLVSLADGLQLCSVDSLQGLLDSGHQFGGSINAGSGSYPGLGPVPR